MLRYLAELAWAPAALILNPTLRWSVISEEAFRVSAAVGEIHGSLEIQLDDDGRIGIVRALRPRLEDKKFVTRPWQGRLFDYRRHCGLWLPFAGEVGWVLDDGLYTAWRGIVTGWECSSLAER